jgi:hypothetical protein
MASQPMTDTEARAEISVLARASDDPALAPGDLDVCVRKSRRADAEGRAPGSANYVPTYDTTHGAMWGWRIKAGIAARRVDVEDANLRIKRSQVRAHCEAEERKYRALLHGTVTVPGPGGS